MGAKLLSNAALDAALLKALYLRDMTFVELAAAAGYGPGCATLEGRHLDRRLSALKAQGDLRFDASTRFWTRN